MSAESPMTVVATTTSKQRQSPPPPPTPPTTTTPLKLVVLSSSPSSSLFVQGNPLPEDQQCLSPENYIPLLKKHLLLLPPSAIESYIAENRLQHALQQLYQVNPEFKAVVEACVNFKTFQEIKPCMETLFEKLKVTWSSESILDVILYFGRFFLKDSTAIGTVNGTIVQDEKIFLMLLMAAGFGNSVIVDMIMRMKPFGTYHYHSVAEVDKLFASFGQVPHPYSSGGTRDSITWKASSESFLCMVLSLKRFYLLEDEISSCNADIPLLNMLAATGQTSLYKTMWELIALGKMSSSLTFAAEHGHLDIVVFITSMEYDTGGKSFHLLLRDALDAATCNGHFHSIRRYFENDTGGKFFHLLLRDALDAATCNGHLHIIRWYFEYAKRRNTPLQPTMLYDLIADASVNGHLNIVKFIHENFPKDVQQDHHQQQHSISLYHAIIGHKSAPRVYVTNMKQKYLEVLKYYFEHVSINFNVRRSRLEPEPSDNELILAAKSGNLDILEYLISYSGTAMETFPAHLGRIFHIALKNGHAHIVDWLEDRFNYHGNNDIIDKMAQALDASASGNVEFFKTMLKKCALPLRNHELVVFHAMRLAIEQGHLEMFIHCASSGRMARDFHNANNHVLRFALKHQNFDIILYICENFGFVTKKTSYQFKYYRLLHGETEEQAFARKQKFLEDLRLTLTGHLRPEAWVGGDLSSSLI